MRNVGEHAIMRATVQILDGEGRACGCGLLVDNHHVITCAHVVAYALGAPAIQVQRDLPSQMVELAFPHSSIRRTWHARVCVWHPCVAAIVDDTPEDIAVIELTSALPNDVGPQGLTQASEWTGRPYLAHGFTMSNPRGDWVDGTFKGPQTNGWVQLLSNDATDVQVAEGFSGCGVWDKSLASFVGILVAVSGRGAGNKPVAKMIPARQLKRAWPALSVKDAPEDQPSSGRGWPRRPSVVHPYTLLDLQRGLVGRQRWLAMLEAWQNDERENAVLTLHAIGGSGKTALAWTWFQRAFANNVDLQGGLWYSFYEPGASFADFLRRLYDYVGVNVFPGSAQRDLRREDFDSLFQALRTRKLLVVLDGFERLLRAYVGNRKHEDASRVNFEFLKTQELNLCTADDENVNAFLRALAQPLASRFLVTSRLVPAAVQSVIGIARNGFTVVELDALEPDDVVAMMSGYGVQGSAAKIKAFAAKFGNHALLVKLVSAIVGNSMSYARNFDSWLAAHPGFDPTSLNVTENRVHVLQCALEQVRPDERRVLLHVAALRGSIAYQDLEQLLFDRDAPSEERLSLESSLKTLHQLTLIEWENGNGRNHFDLHPLVRNTVWLRASHGERELVDKRLISEFEAFPSSQPETRERDQSTALSIFCAFIRLGRFEEAWEFSTTRFQSKQDLFSDLSVSLEMQQAFLTAEGWPQLPRREQRAQSLLQLAKAHELTCDTDQALRFYERHRHLCESPTCVNHQAVVMRDTGKHLAAYGILENVLEHVRATNDSCGEVITLSLLGNYVTEAQAAAYGHRIATLVRRMGRVERYSHRTWLLSCRITLTRLRPKGSDSSIGKQNKLLALARFNVELNRKTRYSYQTAYATRGLADAYLDSDDLRLAEATARQAIDLARKSGLAELVAMGQVTLADVHQRRGEHESVARLIQSATPTARRGNMRGILSRLCLLGAKVARDQGKRDEAEALALEAYREAWCDGPPFSFNKELESAADLLRELQCTLPQDLPTSPGLTVHLFALDHPQRPTAPPLPKGTEWEIETPQEAQAQLYVPSDRPGSTFVDWTIERARACLSDGDISEALRLGQRAVELDPEGHDCWAVQASCWFQIGNLMSALQGWSSALDRLKGAPRRHIIDQSNYYAERALIRTLLRHGVEALHDFDRCSEGVLDLDRKHAAAHAYALALVGRADESAAAFQKALQQSSPSDWHRYFFGCSLHDAGHRGKALQAFRRIARGQDSELPAWLLTEITTMVNPSRTIIQ